MVNSDQLFLSGLKTLSSMGQSQFIGSAFIGAIGLCAATAIGVTALGLLAKSCLSPQPSVERSCARGMCCATAGCLIGAMSIVVAIPAIIQGALLLSFSDQMINRFAGG